MLARPHEPAPRTRRVTPDHRSAVRASVAAHASGSAREARSRRLVLALLDSMPRPFDRSAQPAHVTSSAVVVGPRGTLLHLHKRLRRWLQPGGHVDPGEAPWEAALRETREETGLDVRPPGVPVLLHVDVHPAGSHVHHDLRYLLEVGHDEDPRPAAGESPDVRWFAWDGALAVADEALVGALHAARRRSGV